MGLFDSFPYTNFHDLNLDSIMEDMGRIDREAENATAAAAAAKEAETLAKYSALKAQQAADSIASGSPKVVTLAADMTDTDIIYLYAGTEEGYEAGEWYYWDGSSWVSGGRYGSGKLNSNAINLFEYIFKRIVYTEPGMEPYVDSLIENLRASGGGTGDIYTITYALVNVTSDNPDTEIEDASPFTAHLTPAARYTIFDVKVTMAGVDVTSIVYSNGTIHIDSVNGDLVITAKASDALYDWDLTQSLTDKMQGLTAVTTASLTAGTGLVFGALNQYCDFGAVYSRDRTYEVDVVSFEAPLGTANQYPYRRFFLFDTDADTAQGGNGLICCRYNRYGWYFYCGTAWDSTALVAGTSSDSKYTYFNGKTVKFYLSSTGKMTVYTKTIGADDSSYELVGTCVGTIKTYTNGHAYFGGSSDGLARATFSGFRVYEGEH